MLSKKTLRELIPKRQSKLVEGDKKEFTKILKTCGLSLQQINRLGKAVQFEETSPGTSITFGLATKTFLKSMGPGGLEFRKGELDNRSRETWRLGRTVRGGAVVSASLGYTSNADMPSRIKWDEC